MQDLTQTIIFNLLNIFLTVGSVVYFTGRASGKSQVNADNTAKELTTIEAALQSIQTTMATQATEIAKLNYALFGIAGTNGLRSELKTIENTVHDIEVRLVTLEQHKKE